MKKIPIYKWNPWIGCQRKSQGCKLCSSSAFCEGYFDMIRVTNQLDMPIQVNKDKNFILPKNSHVALQYSGDFFIQEMESIRSIIWNIIRIRKDCTFHIATKRPQNIKDMLPIDWEDGWENIYINCTAQNQKRADERLPIYLNLPLKHYTILTQPLLQQINIEKFLQQYNIDQVVVEGQHHHYPYKYQEVRPCKYSWVKNLYQQCKRTNTKFYFTLTGTKWINQNQEEICVSPYENYMQILANKYNFNTNIGFYGSTKYELLQVYNK